MVKGKRHYESRPPEWVSLQRLSIIHSPPPLPISCPWFARATMSPVPFSDPLFSLLRHSYYNPRAETSYHNFQTSSTPSVSYQSPSTTLSGSAIPRYDPYARPRIAQPAPAASSSAAPVPQPPMPTIRFKYSPFFKMERLVSTVVECPGAWQVRSCCDGGAHPSQSRPARWTGGHNP